MEHESFEDPEIARIMNENFVSIKVDREERPDLDAIYMEAVQAISGHGGWPMTVFLTPDAKPFFGGTYFPPDDRQGMPGFRRVLQAVAELYRTRRGQAVAAAHHLVEQMQKGGLAAPQAAMEPLRPQIFSSAYQSLRSQFDSQHGGFGTAPKFPQPMTLEFLLRYHHRTSDPHALQMVESTLEAMARGGIYDQIGGGFHRYSTDPFWLVPHFEKMLYDNALLTRLYLHAYQVTGKEFYKRVCQESLDYVQREMTDPEGGFYSTQDADSEGEEGKYYVWSFHQIDGILGAEEGKAFRGYYGVTEVGNFEGRNILHVPKDLEAFAQEHGVPPDELEAAIRRGGQRLLEARSARVPPGKDQKVLTAWNGMMLRSFAEAASALKREDYLHAAVANATFVLKELRRDGRLLRSYRDGQAKLKGYLEDYAFLIDGLLALYEATFHREWLDEARSLADQMIDLFWHSTSSLFYDTGADHEELVVRPRDIFDNATPCGSSVAVEVLLRLASFTGEGSYSAIAASALRPLKEYMERHPTGFSHWLCALDYYLSAPKEIAVIGNAAEGGTQALLHVIYSRFLPNRVIAGAEPGDAHPTDGIPLLEGRDAIGGRPTAYVCENYACKLPVTDPEALAEQLKG